ncbi:DUF1648 domain-containing protein [Kaistella sp. PBT33-4]|uniref:DUF1648 domain-containing protein n=1 Tax=Kaistella sp. PBT33-4 TaxID=3032000 RepID=UPI0023D7E1F8|nr:DUF1648 domain-containing protein [Kaistella sp. PBT33-4]MDF0718475.1 DUF1648 domain-containing protein [Kaistella sp. PBT33-4]
MLQKFLTGLNLILLVFIWIYPAVNYNQLPEIIPVHFSGDGIPDGFGSRYMIWLEAGIATLLFGICTYVYFNPSKINLPEDFKKNTHAIQKFISVLCTLVLLIFAWMSYQTVQVALDNTARFSMSPGIIIGLLYVGIIGMIIYLGKANETVKH